MIENGVNSFGPLPQWRLFYDKFQRGSSFLAVLKAP